MRTELHVMRVLVSDDARKLLMVRQSLRVGMRLRVVLLRMMLRQAMQLARQAWVLRLIDRARHRKA